MPRQSLLVCCIVLCALCAPSLVSAQALSLSFAHHVQPTNGTFNGWPVYNGQTMDFEEVSAGVDARVTATVIGSGHVHDFYVPNYRSASTAEPNDDLGAIYRGTPGTTGGVRYTFDFYDSDGNINGLVQATAAHVNEFELMIYDVDGEAVQSESVRAFVDDGFYGYRVAKTQPLNVVEESVGVYRFDGPGSNRSETDASAATILHFRDTSQFSFEMLSTTDAASAPNNRVFQAIDGDVSLADKNDFEAMVNVLPEPGSFLFLLFAGMFGLLHRQRR